jgi:hypothetical protein
MREYPEEVEQLHVPMLCIRKGEVFPMLLFQAGAESFNGFVGDLHRDMVLVDEPASTVRAGPGLGENFAGLSLWCIVSMCLRGVSPIWPIHEPGTDTLKDVTPGWRFLVPLHHFRP